MNKTINKSEEIITHSYDILLRYSDIQAAKVSWLWYPFIPYGKITTVQGDPGEGKSSIMLSIAAKLSRGEELPDGSRPPEPQNVIYQCSEDGIEDTIKPRLIAAGADCSRIAFINEETTAFTLDDEKLRFAISDFRAKLVIIDPVQAYLGNADLSYSGGMRKVLHRLSLWANAYDCAIVLVGHLNKNEYSKGLYRGLGSIDVVASARSVLQVEHIEDRPEIRKVCQIKNSLAAKGPDVFFTIEPEKGVCWIPDEYSYSSNKTEEPASPQEKYTKQETAIYILKNLLPDGPVSSNNLKAVLEKHGISLGTLMIAKKELGVKAFRKNGQWYWTLPENGAGNE